MISLITASVRKWWLLSAVLLAGLYSAHAQRTFTNPIKPSGPDPWVLQKDGWYYYMNTTGANLTLWRTRNIADLATAEKKVIYTPPPGQPYSKELWAPEIHALKNDRGQERWYVYFSADSANNLSHRVWVIENEALDPFAGEWVMKGKIGDPGDHWEIDMSVMEFNGQLYAAWSGWEGPTNGQQDIYIAKLKNPWTLDGDRVRIAQPELPWERHGDVPQAWQKNGEVPKIYVNEGPEFLQHDGKLFLVYSANACWLDYCLGLLTYTGKGDLLDPKSWQKSPQPVFVQAPENGVWAPGHGGFFQTAGRNGEPVQHWMIYHANPSATDGCGNKRAPHIQPFTWNADGSPNFGKPMPKIPMPVPGE
ncbi:glycoside hydrolase family 43 protein [Spirosoma sordidisoli]|uniref:Glycosyl hydrolase family 43 n=1 Tax=Spirosoma sordidisoli TaxID=2502893 RepID=A0A4Q2UCX7_9BACT|nr:glycoside hydrolase family 43 protein [Spirosoma sordidisoli]RYC66907.1 glycosyl hydrolase family 43 [Spirosoma sordidisoli]